MSSTNEHKEKLQQWICFPHIHEANQTFQPNTHLISNPFVCRWMSGKIITFTIELECCSNFEEIQTRMVDAIFMWQTHLHHSASSNNFEFNRKYNSISWWLSKSCHIIIISFEAQSFLLVCLLSQVDSNSSSSSVDCTRTVKRLNLYWVTLWTDIPNEYFSRSLMHAYAPKHICLWYAYNCIKII